MPHREKDCRKLYVTEFFFFWKILVTWGRQRQRLSHMSALPGGSSGCSGLSTDQVVTLFSCVRMTLQVRGQEAPAAGQSWHGGRHNHLHPDVDTVFCSCETLVPSWLATKLLNPAERWQARYLVWHQRPGSYVQEAI